MPLLSPVENTDQALKIPSGLVPGMTSVNKFGAAMDGVQTTSTDIWDRADATPTQQLFVAPTAARVHNIASTDAADDGTPEGAGGGAQAVRVYGLTSWASKEVSEDVVLNGTANVATANAYVIIHRMKVVPVGSTYANNVGVITATAVTDGTVTAQISAAQGQTLMAIYGIPSTQTAYMTGFYVNLHSNTTPATPAEVDFYLLANERPDLDEAVFLVKHAGGIISTATSEIKHDFMPYKSIPGPAIIKMQALGGSADLFMSAGFDLILVDN